MVDEDKEVNDHKISSHACPPESLTSGFIIIAMADDHEAGFADPLSRAERVDEGVGETFC